MVLHSAMTYEGHRPSFPHSLGNQEKTDSEFFQSEMLALMPVADFSVNTEIDSSDTFPLFLFGSSDEDEDDDIDDDDSFDDMDDEYEDDDFEEDDFDEDDEDDYDYEDDVDYDDFEE